MPGNGTVGASYGDLLLTSLVVLGAVCIAAFVVVRLAGRLLATGRSRGAHVLAVVARLPLEPRRSLYVVEVAGKTLLVGTSEMGLSLLSELDGGQVRAHVEDRPSFGELVRRAWLRRRGIGASASQGRDEVRGADDTAPADLEAHELRRRGPADADPRGRVAMEHRPSAAESPDSPGTRGDGGGDGGGDRGEPGPSGAERDVVSASRDGGGESKPSAAGARGGREADERP